MRSTLQQQGSQSWLALALELERAAVRIVKAMVRANHQLKVTHACPEEARCTANEIAPAATVSAAIARRGQTDD